MFKDINADLAVELLEAIRFFNNQGWSRATSTNYSFRSSDPQKYIISRSGVDKSLLKLEDLILINSLGEIQAPFNQPGIKSSAETEIHTFLYQQNPDINCVLHTHSVLGTVLSQTHCKQGKIIFEGFEILKGFEGNTTHQLEEILPIVSNSQKMVDIIKDIEPQLNSQRPPHGFLIAGHGLYAWGKTIAAAKRHIESYEFLFECYHAMRRY